jgi:hypothetical protein
MNKEQEEKVRQKLIQTAIGEQIDPFSLCLYLVSFIGITSKIQTKTLKEEEQSRIIDVCIEALQDLRSNMID